MKYLSIARIGLLVAGMALAGTAQAANYTTIDLSSYANDSWAQTWGVSSFPTGSQTFNGTPFNIASDANGARYASAYLNSTNVITIATNIAQATNAFSLINTIWGQPGPNSYLSITFTGSAGATQTFNLVGDEDIRDFNNFAYTNTINGTTTVNAVTVDGGAHRLDEQAFALDSAFLTQNLTSITMTDTGADGFERGALTGLTIESAGGAAPVPEPAAWALMVGGFGLVGGAMRMRRKTVLRFA
jgi:hypothetical protein